MQGPYTCLACAQMLINEDADADADADDTEGIEGCALFLKHRRLNKFNHLFYD